MWVGLTGVLGGCLGDDDTVETDDDGERGRQGPVVSGVELFHSRPLAFYDPETGDPIADVHGHDDSSHWHFQPLEVPLDAERVVEAVVRNSEEEHLPLGAEEQFQLSVEAEPSDLVTIEIDRNLVSFLGHEEGRGDVTFGVTGPNGDTWTSPELTLEVSESGSTAS